MINQVKKVKVFKDPKDGKMKKSVFLPVTKIKQFFLSDVIRNARLHDKVFTWNNDLNSSFFN